MKINIIIIFLVFSTVKLMAQLPCGVVQYDDVLIKSRMLRNRSDINLPNIRNTVYIPTTIHLIGNSNGSGTISESIAVGMLCKLNEDFADQNIFFYLNGNVRYIYDDYIHSDSYDWGVMNAMESQKVPNSLNIFVNGNVSESVAGYYSPSYDFLWMGNSYANKTSTTITHEAGHFFSLPHTFFGWEGSNALSLYGSSPVSPTINGFPVELFARTNCLTAGDGFCDTDADYLSFRFNCPYNTGLKDPDGDPIDPDPSFYMSYSSDNCMNRFSQEQKNAILADITSRNWLNFSGPPNTNVIDASFVTALEPIDASQITPSAFVRFEWDTTGVGSATHWVFTLERTVLGNSVQTVHNSTIGGNQNFINIPATKFLSNRDYRWSVMPYSSGYTCADPSSFFTFRTGLVSSLKEDETFYINVEVLPNPIKNKIAQLRISSDYNSEVLLRIYSVEGKLCLKDNTIQLESGVVNYQIDLNDLATGIYILQIISDDGIKTEKFVLEGD